MDPVSSLNRSYLSTAVGKALSHTLEDLVDDGKLSEDVAAVLLQKFCQAMREELAQVPNKAELTMTGTVESYKETFGMWNVLASDVTLSANRGGSTIDIPSIKFSGPAHSAQSNK